MTIYIWKCECGRNGASEDERPRFCVKCGKKIENIEELPVDTEEPLSSDSDDPRYHRKRRKAIKVLKFLIGEDVAMIVSDKDLWKQTLQGRAKKIIAVMELDEDDAKEVYKTIDDAIDRVWGKVRTKLK